MIRLLLKAFIAYWIAAGVVIIISDFEPHRQIHNPELTDALDSSLLMNGWVLIDAYRTGHCRAAQRLLTTARNAMYLATPDGHLVCGTPEISDVSGLIAACVKNRKRTTANFALFQLIAFPVVSREGQNYVLLFKNSYSSALHVYGFLPGYTTIYISLVVTLFLAILIALPIRRLRQAAGQIAMGQLDARVRWRSFALRGTGHTGGDDIDQLVRDFNYMAERLESLAQAQRLLLREISHELRSPLTRIGVCLGLARSESRNNVQLHLDRIEAEAGRLNNLIGQILSLSRLDMIYKIDTPATLSLSELVADLLPDLKYEAAQSNCAIETVLSESCYVLGDAELLRSAIENVLRNAIKYAPPEGLIHVGTSTEERSGATFSMVRISDNGPGIPEEELKSVLEPFYRADKSRHWQKDGFGIGLAIADRAARLHKGMIGICNKPGGGLIVDICLPSAPMTNSNRIFSLPS